MTFTNDNISQVFSRYIENFVKINDDEHEEYYKWQVCHEFKNLMDKALKTEDYKFSKALMKVTPLYNFFSYKIIVQGLLMYNEFAQSL